MIKRQPFSLDHFKELKLEDSDIGYDACSQLCQVLKYTEQYVTSIYIRTASMINVSNASVKH
jgi:hypothetical protein